MYLINNFFFVLLRAPETLVAKLRLQRETLFYWRFPFTITSLSKVKIFPEQAVEALMVARS
jgi:hypothetical protein